jgi:hypothetical protein
MAQERSTEDQNHILSLKNQLKKGLLAYNSNISFNGPEDDSECLSTVLNAQFPPHPKNDMFLMLLGKRLEISSQPEHAGGFGTLLGVFVETLCERQSAAQATQDTTLDIARRFGNNAPGASRSFF